jgi:hypothetical protein
MGLGVSVACLVCDALAIEGGLATATFLVFEHVFVRFQLADPASRSVVPSARAREPGSP